MIRFDEVVMWNLQPSNVYCPMVKDFSRTMCTYTPTPAVLFWSMTWVYRTFALYILATAHDVWLLIAQTTNIKTIKLWIYGQKLWKEMPVIFGLNFISVILYFFFFLFFGFLSRSQNNKKNVLKKLHSKCPLLICKKRKKRRKKIMYV